MQRKILLNPGPATTTDSVKQAQVVPDICPREKEFGDIMREISKDLLKIVRADPNKYAAILFCGSGTLCMDVSLNSLLPKDKKILIVNNGAYSSRGADICRAYNLPFTELKYPPDQLSNLSDIKKILEENPDISVVYTTHQETGTGILNPIKEIGEIAHSCGATFIVDTTSTFAMLPMDIENDNVDFCMASAQKGIQGMTGLSFIIGDKKIIEESKNYPVRSYYCNLFAQYDYFEKNGQMRFTPPVQTIYAAREALKEYFIEGETAKYERHKRVINAIHKGAKNLGFKEVIPRKYQSGLVVALKYPENDKWDFNKIHDYCYERGYTIYPGKMEEEKTFRLCALGAIDEKDIEGFFKVFKDGLKRLGM